MKKLLLILYAVLLSWSSFGQSTDAALTTQSNVIRDETAAGGNTKTRIAAMYQAIIDSKVNRGELITASGTNTYTATGATGLALSTNFLVVVKFTNANTGASTLNITPSGGSALGAKSIKKSVNVDVSSGDIAAGQIFLLVYDGTNFQLIGGSGGSSSVTADNVTFTPAGHVDATDVQAAVEEVDAEKTALTEVINTQTDDYTLLSTDFDDQTILVMNKATAVSVTVPPGVTAAGRTLTVRRINTGQVTFVQGSGQTITPSRGALTDPGANIDMVLRYLGSNTWDLQNANPISLTSTDITDALGFTPANSTDANLQWTQVTTTTNFATTSTSYVDIDPTSGPSLEFPITSGVAMDYEAVIYATTSDGNGGVGYSLNGPTATTYYSHWLTPTSATAVIFRSGTGYGTETVSASILTTGVISTGRGRIQTSASGTVIFRVACETTVAHTITVLAGSYIRYRPSN